MESTLQQLAEYLNAELIADPGGQRTIRAVAAVELAGEHDITYVMSRRHVATATTSQAGAILVGQAWDEISLPQLVVDDVELALIKVLEHFAPRITPAKTGIHPTAVIGNDVQLGDDCAVGPHVVIEDGARLGNGCVIASGCKIGENTDIGDHTFLDTNVVVYYNCQIGKNVIIQANSTIGAVGFGYIHRDGVHHLIPHNGGVIIEDFVHIGANCCIDRAKFANTIVGSGTKIDNLVQVGHNVVIGKCCLICGQVGISGSCRIGDGVVLAGKAGLADNLVIGDGATVGAGSGIMTNVPAGQTVVWSPALEQGQAKRVVGEVLRLPKTVKRFKQLAKRLDKLEAAENHTG
jgi:UDP-3-O-[3-hydroxymyristoyl] glucosamine N-acyltransferase